jgi:hypothetical protein
MKKIMIAAVAGAALFAGASAASAQSYYNDGPDSYVYRGPMVESGVGLQVGPVGIGVYGGGPAYDGGWYRGNYGYSRPMTRDNSTYNSEAFRSQEVWPQSPPGGGY